MRYPSKTWNCHLRRTYQQLNERIFYYKIKKIYSHDLNVNINSIKHFRREICSNKWLQFCLKKN